MVSVVQLVEHQVVILGVAGSSPVTHPNRAAGCLWPWALCCPRRGLAPATFVSMIWSRGEFDHSPRLHLAARSNTRRSNCHRTACSPSPGPWQVSVCPVYLPAAQLSHLRRGLFGLTRCFVPWLMCRTFETPTS
ncbi:Putative uncharacterized protein [Mycobacterium tuberculosis variant bovis]|uniref:Uncharacterized protein n=1 Tax=Mycobacterium tuberculosis (strain CDC 1551 / Oshkosh) TaxID=83331 RepID=Q8VJH3_MYCTO|nr:hypothetical protein MT2586.1 [Mycobacterium tuberculosis CDC1551]CEJ29788.1 Putative uncharacterized protein [Mycobacterium tuberculosis variant bovis]CEJ35798.1 Putative uncharacterized protein [Mycobacterium tuberculosis variant bovis]CEJ39723.1 Putative uncharacterized protein [Mycobacterium tuberculosis variant bovis]CEJ53033.1 Putative uncharacterized protein [Mycobacterium tuberculosis variant caprae]